MVYNVFFIGCNVENASYGKFNATMGIGWLKLRITDLKVLLFALKELLLSRLW